MWQNSMADTCYLCMHTACNLSAAPATFLLPMRADVSPRERRGRVAMDGKGDTHHRHRLRRRPLLTPTAAAAAAAVKPAKCSNEYRVPVDVDRLLLTLPGEWLIRLVVSHAELAISCFLFIASPFLHVYFTAQAVPSRVARGLAGLARRLALGLLGALYVMALLFVVMVASVVIGVCLVRMWTEEPVSLRRPLHFDYGEAQPSAEVVLRGSWQGGRAVPAEHTVRVAIALRLPESDYNRRIGVFQVHVEVIGSTGETISSSGKPCMLRFRSLPVRMMRTFLMGIPILLGICSESQEISMEILTYKEPRRRSEVVRVRLQPRAGTANLPQLYAAELLMRSKLPWAKALAHNWRWTLYVWASLYVYFVLLVLLACCFKLWPSGRMRFYPGASGGGAEGEVSSGKFSDALRGWRERSKRTRVSMLASSSWLRRGGGRRPELHEGSASSTTSGGGGGGGGRRREGSEEVIDDSGDFAASESSECVG